MTYLKEFATQAEYDAFVESGAMVKPNVSLVNEPFGVFYTKRSESDVIEYHFEIPMESMGFAMEGEIEGDFSELYNKLVSFAKEYGTENENGEWYVPNETVDKKINITVNEDKVTSLEFYSQYNEVNCSTTSALATFKLYADSAYYEKTIDYQ